MARRYDRTGDLIEDDLDHAVEHDALCVAGWLPDDPMGRAVPCLTCRPHLAGRRIRFERQIRSFVR